MNRDYDNDRTSWLPSFRTGVLLLFIVTLAAWCGWYFYAKHELDVRLEKLRAAGEPLNIKEWYAQAEANLPKVRNPHAEEILGFLYDLKVKDFQTSVGTTSPILEDTLGTDEDILYNDWPDYVVEDAQKVLEANAALLQKIDVIAAYPPVHPTEAILYKKESSLPVYPTPDLLAMRGLMNLLTIKSIKELRNDDLDSAISSQETAYKIVEHYDTLPPSLINAMISVAYRSIINKSTAEILNSGLLDAWECKRISILLKDRYPQGRMYAAFRFTRMESLENYPGMMIYNGRFSQALGRPYSFLDFLFKTVLRPYSYQDATAYIDAMERFLGILESYEDAPWTTLDESQYEKIQESIAWYMFAMIVTPNVIRAGGSDLYARTYHVLLETSVSLKQYQLEFGEYPKSLKILVPKYLEKLPLDLFDGRPLQYKKKDQGFLLWSIGEDLKDEGGKVDAKDPCALQTNDDIVMQLGNK